MYFRLMMEMNAFISFGRCCSVFILNDFIYLFVFIEYCPCLPTSRSMLFTRACLHADKNHIETLWFAEYNFKFVGVLLV